MSCMENTDHGNVPRTGSVLLKFILLEMPRCQNNDADDEVNPDQQGPYRNAFIDKPMNNNNK